MSDCPTFRDAKSDPRVQALSAWPIQSSLSTFHLILMDGGCLNSSVHHVLQRGRFLAVPFLLSLLAGILL